MKTTSQVVSDEVVKVPAGKRYWVRVTRPDGSSEPFSFHVSAQGAVRAAEQCMKLAKDGVVFEALRAVQ